MINEFNNVFYDDKEQQDDEPAPTYYLYKTGNVIMQDE